MEETIWGGGIAFVREDFRFASISPSTGGLGAAQLK
jgi:hypothetical protein